MKIAVLDPILAKTGHYMSFNRYILDLLDVPENDIFLADISNTFSRWYSSYCPKNASFRIVNVADRLSNRARASNFIQDGIRSISDLQRDRRWYSSIIEKIAAWHPDIVLLTSQPRNGFFKISRMKAPVAIIFHSIKKIVGSESRNSAVLSLKLRTERVMTNRFLRSNSVLAILLEDSTLSKIASRGYKTCRIPAYAYPEPSAELPSGKHRSDRFTMSSVGTINKGKNIDFLLDVIQKHKPEFFVYRISGNPRGSYGEEIVRRTANLRISTLETNFGYLSDEQYWQEISTADFILIPYERSREGQSSGVMFDAMKCGTPIIAADIEPFKMYVEKYKIGVLYEEGNEDDLLEAMRTAHERGKGFFDEAIRSFREEHSISKWRFRFNTDLRHYVNEWNSDRP
jgi:glycosyltransferase involved in cell wall biosynthesis